MTTGDDLVTALRATGKVRGTFAEWQPIETAPKDGTDVLLCLCETDTMIVAGWDDESPAGIPLWRTLDGLGYHPDAPTHWMPLPSPPVQ